ncbi:bifunctional aspartokinase/homoserine dehydrogenase 2, chloroplastic-like [Vigna umbellata]|uniref:bifunctional aspartokinase/homoserine dehydrogenase 2, chloroplastic-like n=1 Tax=Vigna umbellata TaxID=87088 RepID=UPI001F5F39C0|nr:bifunctional aspartokinase/homoserine dehydrogenase 2, chloroplastic-like [Vigna umbellata]
MENWRLHYKGKLVLSAQSEWMPKLLAEFPNTVTGGPTPTITAFYFNTLWHSKSCSIPQVAIIPNCSILAAVGQKMASTPGVSASLFNALAKANINVRAIAQGCSEYNITVVVKREDCIKALRAVHSRFYLSRTTISMGIIGPGLIGSTLLDQLRDQASILKEEFNIDLRVMGILGSKSMLLSDAGIDLTRWRELREERGEAADLEKFVQHVHGNNFIPNTALVDCTADSVIAGYYYEWLRKGIHVVTPNKKANSGPLEQYLRLRALQRQSYTHYFYEATVGAGLPIVSTLRGLLETGDRILQIEGIFSGTLSYIFNNFKDGRAFSEVVAEAKEAGYTEPDPRDDMSGTDVARKVQCAFASTYTASNDDYFVAYLLLSLENFHTIVLCIQYLRLRALQRQSYTHYFYEATVGAGLPIVSTLRGLLETGDRILQIEGIFSGTLSYIFNNFKDGRAFSEVVAEAKEAGYTEPDPRDDMSGTDVARKVQCGICLPNFVVMLINSFMLCIKHPSCNFFHETCC